MITPTVGRIVWFFYYHQRDTPLAAIVTKVNSPTSVNLCVFAQNGARDGFEDVELVQPGQAQPDGPDVVHCEWMPYQVKKRTGSESGEPAVGEVSI